MSVCLQLNCAASVASDFYFRSRLSPLTLDTDTVSSPVSQLPTVTASGSVGNCHNSLDLTLIVLWQVVVPHSLKLFHFMHIRTASQFSSSFQFHFLVSVIVIYFLSMFFYLRLLISPITVCFLIFNFFFTFLSSI